MRRIVLLLVATLVAAGIAVGGIALLKPAMQHAADVNAAKTPAPAPAEPVITEPTQTQRVVIFVRNKQVGERVDATVDLTVAPMPVADMPADAFTSLDVSSDPVARNTINGWEVLREIQAGQPAIASSLQAPEEGTAVQPRMELVKEPDVKGNPADIKFLEQLTNDPSIVLFAEEQLSGLRLRSGVVVDITVESPASGFGAGNWVARETVVTGATLRATSLDVTGKGATPVFYAQLTDKQADKVRAAQAIANGRLKVEPHRDARALPPIGHICTGPQDNQVCFEELSDEELTMGATDEEAAEIEGETSTTDADAPKTK